MPADDAWEDPRVDWDLIAGQAAACRDRLAQYKAAWPLSKRGPA